MKIEATNSLSFKELIQSPEQFSPKQQVIITEIRNKVSTVQNGAYENTPLIEWLNQKGCDLFMASGKYKNSIKLQLRDQDSQFLPIDIGEYKSRKHFNTNFNIDAINGALNKVDSTLKNRDRQKNWKWLIWIPILLAEAFLGYAMITGKTSSHQQNTIKKEIVSDTLKNITGTIKKIPKDTLTSWKI